MAKSLPPLKSHIMQSIEEREEAAKLQIEKKLRDKDIELIDIDFISEIRINGYLMHNRTAIAGDELQYLEELSKDIKGLKGSGIFGTGLINPITIRKINESSYERIAGFRRLEAFKKLGYLKIPAIVIECDDTIARKIRNSENQQRRKLNAYDELIGQLEEIMLECSFENIKQTASEIFKLLYIIKTNKNKTGLSHTQQIILKKIDEFGMSPKGFEFKLKILNLNQLLINEITENNMQYSYAILLNKIKDTNQLQEMLEFIRANSNNISRRIISSKVDELLQKKEKVILNKKLEAPVQLEKILAKIKNKELSNEVYYRIEKFNKELSELINNNV